MAQRSALRSELYDRVWSVPIKRLAPELGLSDVGLAKVCRRFKIPTPPRGYWARLEFGKAVSRVPLPPSDTQNEVVTWVVERPHADRLATRWEALLHQARELPPITVKHGPFQHPLVRETAHQLAKGFPRAQAPRDVLRVEVSASAADRALRVMDALLRACEANGWSISTQRREHFVRPIAQGGVWTVPRPDARNVSTQIVVNREPMAIALVERFGRRPPTRAEIRQHKKTYPYGVLTEVTAPTGELSLAVLSHGSLGHRKVSDTADARLEDQLNRFMVMLVRAAIAVRHERVQWAVRMRDERRAEQRRAVAEGLRQAHRRRVRFFDQAVRRWRRQRTQLAFLRALKRAGAEHLTDSAFAEWLNWAEGHVQGAGLADVVRQIAASASGQEPAS